MVSEFGAAEPCRADRAADLSAAEGVHRQRGRYHRRRHSPMLLQEQRRIGHQGKEYSSVHKMSCDVTWDTPKISCNFIPNFKVQSSGKYAS